jgi:hypothetical protein
MTQEAGGKATAEQGTPARPKWLVMIYLAGDNNLSPNSIAILQELESANPPRDEVRVLACFDSNTPRPKGARYVEINRRVDTTQPQPTPCWDLHNDLVPFKQIPGHPVTAPNFCDPDPANQTPISEPVAKEGLSRFLNFALSNHTADRYMLILFGHGSAVAGNTFLTDDNPPSFLRLREFEEVLARHFDDRPGTNKPKLDVLACDNCMMNGIETAYQLRRRVDYVLGSQGLMLTVGWPFRKLIRTIVRHKDDSPRRIARRMLRLCARNLVDFSLMDRSSEQAVCDLTTLRRDRNVVTAVRKLVAAMIEALEFDDCGDVRYPAVRDAIRLARLEAQSYWGETFVDLYDFCELLLVKCNEALNRQVQLLILLQQRQETFLTRQPAPEEAPAGQDKEIGRADGLSTKELLLLVDPVLKNFDQIARRCWGVLEEISELSQNGGKRFVRRSYYVGPDAQYSHGVSIYFPWTLPQNPIIFEPEGGDGYEAARGGSGGGQGLSWVSFDRVGKSPTNFIFKTAFDEYKEYAFAKSDAGDWAAFLDRFFRATLRKVRRFDSKYDTANRDSSIFFEDTPLIEPSPFLPPESIDLQKSSSSTGDEDDCSCSTIKNYPRRFYLSPADCMIKCKVRDEPEPEIDPAADCDSNQPGKGPCVSYLGWNVTGLVASVIGIKPNRTDGPGDDDDEIDQQEDCDPKEY